MPSRADFDKLNALIIEAVALCAAAQERFQQINEDLKKAIGEGQRITLLAVAEKEEARMKLFDSRRLLSERLSSQYRLIHETTKTEN